MALMKCQECGKEISDKAEACPHCGCPVEKNAAETKENEVNSVVQTIIKEQTEISPKKSMSKKKFIVMGSILGGVIIIGLTTYFLTGNLRRYNSAQEFFEQKDYVNASKEFQNLGEYKDSSEKYIDSQYSYAVQLFTEGDYKTAADIFKTLGNYKDTTDKLKESIYLQASSLYGDEKYADAMVMLEEIKDYKDANNLLEDCKYQQSVDAQFIRALAKGLMERWDLNVDNSSMSATEIKENYKKCVNAELNSIGEFADKKFENQGLKKNMDRYIEALNIQLNAIDHYELDYTRFNNEWSDGYNKRAVLIKKFVRNYDLKVESEYESDIDSFINDADLITEQENIKEKVEKMISVEFDIVENNYGWKTYEATIENITDVTFLYFAVIANLYDENDIIVESPYTNQINNFEPGQKVKVSFTTDKSFVRMDTEVNYSVK